MAAIDHESDAGLRNSVLCRLTLLDYGFQLYAVLTLVSKRGLLAFEMRRKFIAWILRSLGISCFILAFQDLGSMGCLDRKREAIGLEGEDGVVGNVEAYSPYPEKSTEKQEGKVPRV